MNAKTIIRGPAVIAAALTGFTQGVFFDGSTLGPNNDADKRLYNRSVGAKEIVIERKVSAPSAAELLLSELNRRSPKNLSS